MKIFAEKHTAVWPHGGRAHASCAGSCCAACRTRAGATAQPAVSDRAATASWNATSAPRTPLAHDFARISVHPARNDGDMRGYADDHELDDRQEFEPAPDHRLLCKASATGVKLGASGPINDGTVYGLRTPIIVRGTELADVLDSELVGASIDHTGSMAKRPSAKSSNSGFMPADNIPDDRHTSGIADHLSYFDDHGGDGSYARLQLDLHKIPSCNINDPWPIANSGYRIKREVKAEGSKVVGIVTKTAEDVTIDGFSTTAGLTPKKEAKVTLRS